MKTFLTVLVALLALNSAGASAGDTNGVKQALTACTQGNLGQSFTNDAVVEYPLAEAGTYLAVDAGDYADCIALFGGQEQSISNLLVFPTSAADVVFVRFNLTSNTGAVEHLALLQMSGARIRRMRLLTPAAPMLQNSSRRNDNTFPGSGGSTVVAQSP